MHVLSPPPRFIPSSAFYPLSRHFKPRLSHYRVLSLQPPFWIRVLSPQPRFIPSSAIRQSARPHPRFIHTRRRVFIFPVNNGWRKLVFMASAIYDKLPGDWWCLGPRTFFFPSLLFYSRILFTIPYYSRNYSWNIAIILNKKYQKYSKYAFNTRKLTLICRKKFKNHLGLLVSFYNCNITLAST